MPLREQRTTGGHMRFVRQVVVGLALLTVPAAAGAQTPSAPRLVLVCAPCHGFDGVGHDRTIPNLAGQHRDYLFEQITAFRSRQRIHPTMNFFSGQLTREELEGIVTYYSALPRP
jgi:cytochrome c553